MLALLFQVGSLRVAVEVRHVREVVPRVRLTPTTGTPPWLAGEFIYRGRVVPVIDLHRLAHAGECPLHLSSRIILVPALDQPESLVGFLATQVAEIRELASGIPTASLAGTNTFGPAIADGNEVLRLFDPHDLLNQLQIELAPARGATP